VGASEGVEPGAWFLKKAESYRILGTKTRGAEEEGWALDLKRRGVGRGLPVAKANTARF